MTYMKPKKRFHSFLSALKVLNGFVIIMVLYSCNTDKNKYTTYKALNYEDATFMGSVSCKTCHQGEFKDWQNSHHDQAMKIADSSTILADFNNSTFTHKGVTPKVYTIL